MTINSHAPRQSVAVTIAGVGGRVIVDVSDDPEQQDLVWLRFDEDTDETVGVDAQDLRNAIDFVLGGNVNKPGPVFR